VAHSVSQCEPYLGHLRATDWYSSYKIGEKQILWFMFDWDHTANTLACLSPFFFREIFRKLKLLIGANHVRS
jgi:hypothetical protein